MREKKQLPLRRCINPDCAVTYAPTRPWQEYCKPSCRVARFSLARIEKLEEYKFMYLGLEK